VVSSIRIVAVGKLKDRNITLAVQVFLKRLRPLSRIAIIELKDEGIEKEAKKLGPYISHNSYILDVAGQEYTSEAFSTFIAKSETQITFILGGPEGISPDLKKTVKSISLSRMTFTHELARLLLVEQLYRAHMINSGRTYYHK
jgi:23S rRNA (pseudouridine1915-N3)-methyltransferase